MARSFRRNPFVGNTKAESNKADKTAANRRFRRLTRAVLTTVDDDTVFPVEREVSNVWDFAKDGVHRFDPTATPQLARK